MVHDETRILEHEGPFETADGPRLYERWWRPQGQPRALVIIVHGYAEYGGRYAHVGEQLARSGYAAAALDLRGHGRSEGRRAYVRTFDEYLQDLGRFLAHAREQQPGLPVYLLGHSMGGAIALLFTLAHQEDLAGLILSAPVVKLGGDISPLLQKLSTVIARIAPRLPTIKLDCRLISRDPEVVQRYDTDPLVYRRGTPARTGAELVQAGVRCQAQAENLTLPLLILHGSADGLVEPQGSEQVYARAASRDKTLKRYQGFFHEVLNELGKAQVLADIVDWLDAHAKAETPSA